MLSSALTYGLVSATRLLYTVAPMDAVPISITWGLRADRDEWRTATSDRNDVAARPVWPRLQPLPLPAPIIV